MMTLMILMVIIIIMGDERTSNQKQWVTLTFADWNRWLFSLSGFVNLWAQKSPISWSSD